MTGKVAEDAQFQPIRYGNYLLLDRINVGGMAEVFRAKSSGLAGVERLVAIKRILPHLAQDQGFTNMFIDEARIAIHLRHANIAQLYELNQIDRSLFIAMEYVQGRDLRALINRMRFIGRAIPLPLIVYVISKVCEGLDYAHRKRDDLSMRELNIVHRDVSPQNVILSYEGEVKIIDFGIAKATAKKTHTQAGILKGKFGYMAPEQVMGREIDRRADIFCTGILAYELLTRERLFAGSNELSTLRRIRQREITPPTIVNPGIPQVIEDTVLKALALEPEDRYQYASDFGEALQRALLECGEETYSSRHLRTFMHEVFGKDLKEDLQRLEVVLQHASVLEEAEGWSHRGMLSTAPESVAPPSHESMTEGTSEQTNPSWRGDSLSKALDESEKDALYPDTPSPFAERKSNEKSENQGFVEPTHESLPIHPDEVTDDATAKQALPLGDRGDEPPEQRNASQLEGWDQDPSSGGVSAKHNPSQNIGNDHATDGSPIAPKTKSPVLPTPVTPVPPRDVFSTMEASFTQWDDQTDQSETDDMLKPPALPGVEAEVIPDLERVVPKHESRAPKPAPETPIEPPIIKDFAKPWQNTAEPPQHSQPPKHSFAESVPATRVPVGPPPLPSLSSASSVFGPSPAEQGSPLSPPPLPSAASVSSAFAPSLAEQGSPLSPPPLPSVSSASSVFGPSLAEQGQGAQTSPPLPFAASASQQTPPATPLSVAVKRGDDMPPIAPEMNSPTTHRPSPPRRSPTLQVEHAPQAKKSNFRVWLLMWGFLGLSLAGMLYLLFVVPPPKPDSGLFQPTQRRAAQNRAAPSQRPTPRDPHIGPVQRRVAPPVRRKVGEPKQTNVRPRPVVSTPRRAPVARRLVKRKNKYSLWVASDPPGATIFVNGVDKGITPKILNFTNPRLRIELRKEGYETLRKTWRWSGKKRSEQVSWSMRKIIPLQKGYLTITSTPEAVIYIDGITTEQKSLRRRAVKPGEHQISFVTKDGDVWDVKVVVNPGTETKLHSRYKKP